MNKFRKIVFASGEDNICKGFAVVNVVLAVILIVLLVCIAFGLNEPVEAFGGCPLGPSGL